MTINDETILDAVRIMVCVYGMVIVAQILLRVKNGEDCGVNAGALLAAIVMNTVVLIYLIVVPYRSVMARVAQNFAIAVLYYTLYRSIRHGCMQDEIAEMDREGEDEQDI